MRAFYNEKFHYLHTKTEDFSGVVHIDHVHPRYEILYFLNGEADYLIGGSTYHLRKRDFLLIQPGVYHRLIPNVNYTYERICLHFDIDCVPDFLQEDIKKFKPVLHVHKYSPLDNLFSGLFQAEHQDNFSCEDMIYLVSNNIGTILTHLKYLQHQDDVVPVQTNSLISGILDYIDQNVTSDINVDTISKAFYKSTSSISHLFSSVMKVPIKQYIINKKMVYAQSLIQSGENPTSVALKLSFTDYSTFFKAYKRVLGIKPTDDLNKN